MSLYSPVVPLCFGAENLIKYYILKVVSDRKFEILWGGQKKKIYNNGLNNWEKPK